MSQFEYVIKEGEENLTLKEILRRRLGFSSRLVKKLKTEGGVYRNGVQVRMFLTGKPGDIVTVDLPQERSEFVPLDIPINIVYEDDDLLIFNKQPGVVVHPTHGHTYGTMANAIMKYMIDTEQSFKIRFANRIDMNTSGLVITAKNSHAQDNLMKQMGAGKVEKRYLAVTEGIILSESGVIDLPIGREGEDSVRRAVREDGYASVTHYTVIERYRSGNTLVELKLDTGRTHQIRVHLAYIGHPLVADELYNNLESPTEGLIDRQALHAWKLTFAHPVTGERMEVEAPIPEDFRMLTERLK